MERIKRGVPQSMATFLPRAAPAEQNLRCLHIGIEESGVGPVRVHFVQRDSGIEDDEGILVVVGAFLELAVVQGEHNHKAHPCQDVSEDTVQHDEVKYTPTQRAYPAKDDRTLPDAARKLVASFPITNPIGGGTRCHTALSFNSTPRCV
jgi:hypothetical protein